MKRVCVSVATDSWVRGQERLRTALEALGEPLMRWTNFLPLGCPPHRSAGLCAGAEPNTRPYSFKAFAMKAAADAGNDLLLWCDASIVPIQSLDPLWERIERDGVWLCRNGWQNSAWTADSAYPDLFPDLFTDIEGQAVRPSDTIWGLRMICARESNAAIPHVVATAFGLNVRHEKGAAFLAEYFRLASETLAFCGPWQNSNAPRVAGRNQARLAGPCGPPTTFGHRHDQSSASVIAWRLGVELDDPPHRLAYDGGQVESTILLVKEIPGEQR